MKGQTSHRKKTLTNLILLFVWSMAAIISFTVHIDAPPFVDWSEMFANVTALEMVATSQNCSMLPHRTYICILPFGRNSKGYGVMVIMLQFIIPLIAVIVSQILTIRNLIILTFTAVKGKFLLIMSSCQINTHQI